MKKIIISIYLSLFCPLLVDAKIIQILHTNDTHSYLAYSTHQPNQGGMARMKALIDQYKSEALQKNIKSIVLDAGDFLEGNVFYLAEEGRKSFEIHNEMGYDASAVGNHDYLMGSENLDQLLGSIDLKFSLLASNISVNKKFNNIRTKINPYTELNIDGIKVAILGLTTNDRLYKWSLDDSEITDPIKTAQYYEDELKQRGNDVIIALTHIGVLEDLKLAKKTKQIDLIVGGHSHTALFQPIYETNVNAQSIPIVQAGMHTEYLGRILVDIEKGKPLKIIKYELIPINNNTINPEMAGLVNDAQADLETLYGKDNLNEILGVSLLNSNDKDGMAKWGTYIADTLREATNTDISIHSPEMNSEDFPSGPFTRLDLYNSIPRIFNLKDKLGWNIFTVTIKGLWIRSLIDIQSRMNQKLVFSGFQYEKNGKMTIGGEKIHPFKNYTVAFAEGVIKGAAGISEKTFSILKNPTETKLKIWNSLEKKIARDLKETEQGSKLGFLIPYKH